MTKMTRIVLAVVLLPFVVGLSKAATQFIGQLIQQVDAAKVGGTSVTVGAGASGAGTQRVILASDSPTGLTDAQLRATAVPISAVSLPLPVGAATESTLSGVKIGTDRIPSQGQAVMSASLPVVIASNQTPVQVTIQTSSALVHVRVTATTISALLLAFNSARKGLECESACTNPSSRVFLRFGDSAATANDKPLESCSSWEPPSTVIPTAAIQVVSALGSQVITCIEY